MATRRSHGEGTIGQDSRGRWVGRIMVNGRRKAVYGKTRKEVADKLRGVDPKLDATCTLGELVDRYLDLEIGRLEDEGLKPGTLDHKRAMLAHFAPLRRRSVADLRTDEVRSCLADMAAKGAARSVIKRAKSQLGTVIEWARNEGLVHRNAARAALMPAGITPRRERRSLTRPELDAIQDAATGTRIEHLIDVETGLCLRPGEVLALRWADVDFDAGAVMVAHSLAADGSLGPTKTPRSRRALKASPSVMTALAAQRAAQTHERERRLARGQGWENLDLVFPTRNGTPTSESNLRKQLRAVCLRAGTEEFSPNELRHTGASLLLDQGMDRTAVSRYLRHTSTRMLDMFYGDEIAPIVDIDAPDVLAV